MRTLVCPQCPQITTVYLLSTHADRTLFFLIFACEVVYLIEVLEKMAKMRPYIILLSLKPIKMSSDFVLNYLKKLYGAPPLK